MYIFALTVSVFLFLAYHYISFEQRQVILSWFLWGIAFCIPGLLLRSWFAFLYPNFWGSIFLVYSLSMLFFIMPLALALAGIYVTLRIRKKTIPEKHEIEAFLLGWSALFLAGHAIEYWGKLYWVYALAVPILYLSLLCFTIPWLRQFFMEDFPEIVKPISIMLGMALTAGLITSLPFFGLGLITVIATAFAGVGAGYYWVKENRKLLKKY